jgi:hypothetical protein
MKTPYIYLFIFISCIFISDQNIVSIIICLSNKNAILRKVSPLFFRITILLLDTLFYKSIQIQLVIMTNLFNKSILE